LDREFWAQSGGRETWQQMHGTGEQEAQVHLLRRCTYAGRPFGEEEFVARLEERFQRKWRRWSFESAGGAATM
jgi:putative transposase